MTNFPKFSSFGNLLHKNFSGTFLWKFLSNSQNLVTNFTEFLGSYKRDLVLKNSWEFLPNFFQEFKRIFPKYFYRNSWEIPRIWSLSLQNFLELNKRHFEKFLKMGYNKFLEMGYDKFPEMGYDKFLEMGYDKFLEMGYSN